MRKIVFLIAFVMTLGITVKAQNIMRYKISYYVTQDGQKFKYNNGHIGMNDVVYLNFNSDKSRFYICDAEGYRNVNMGGFADREMPEGGTGFTTTGYYPIDYQYNSTDANGVKIYMDKRPVFTSTPNVSSYGIQYTRSISYYTYDVFKFSSDYSRINVKVEERQCAPLMIHDASCTYVLELMGNPANSNDTFY